MDRRTLLALVLTAIVIVSTPLIFPSPKKPPVAKDSVALRDTTRTDTTATRSAQATPSTMTATSAATTARAPIVVAAKPETTTVSTPHASYAIVSPGGTPASVSLTNYRSLRERASSPVGLVDPGARLFHLRLVRERDTLALDTVSFRAEPQRTEGNSVVQTLTSTNVAQPVTLTYRFQRDSFVVRLDGTAAGARQVLVTLPDHIRSEERDARDDARHLSFAYKTGSSEVQSVPYTKLEPQSVYADSGAIRWITQRNKYFVVAVIPAAPDSLFRRVDMQGGPRVEKEATIAHTTATLPLHGNTFALRVYAGPQAWDHLRKAAPDLENVNPYGGLLHGVVQPFATIMMRLLLWIKATLSLSYGWVLVIFGVVIRVLLWPLNQNAMRSSMKLQRIQPQLAEVQKRYADNPEKQRDAMMKLYQEHGMSPFTPVLGCLPMLLPMPILFALYFVFNNTIELRGVSFLWLPDLSLKDPFFITPLFMGISMFALSWIGMRGMPPSPQGKMMSYVMPVMFTALFWNFASGLNLYYAVQNVAALPQQWLLARERTAKPSAPTGPKGTGREKG